MSKISKKNKIYIFDNEYVMSEINEELLKSIINEKGNQKLTITKLKDKYNELSLKKN